MKSTEKLGPCGIECSDERGKCVVSIEDGYINNAYFVSRSGKEDTDQTKEVLAKMYKISVTAFCEVFKNISESETEYEFAKTMLLRARNQKMEELELISSTIESIK